MVNICILCKEVPAVKDSLLCEECIEIEIAGLAGLNAAFIERLMKEPKDADTR